MLGTSIQALMMMMMMMMMIIIIIIIKILLIIVRSRRTRPLAIPLAMISMHEKSNSWVPTCSYECGGPLGGPAKNDGLVSEMILLLGGIL